MLAVTYISFAVVGALCAALQFWQHRSSPVVSVGNNPIFLTFQRSFFGAYLLATFADWLQGPYLYRLYSHYGFQVGVMQ